MEEATIYERLLSLPELDLIPHELPQLGTVYLRRQNSEDRWRLLLVQQDLAKNGVKSVPPYMVVAASICDAKGEHVIPSDKFQEGIQILRRRIHSTDMDALYLRTLEITGLGKNAADDTQSAEKPA